MKEGADMALGNFYLGGNGQPNDTLHRVAFVRETTSHRVLDSYYFHLNPSQITASYPARNVFNQTLHTVLMQGYGMGIHTIQIQGQTGYNKTALHRRGPTGWGTGFQKAKKLKQVITNQINSAHDANSPSQTSTLYFKNYTDEVAYKVECDQNGLQFQQSDQDPLTFYYTISMVVIAPAYEPNPDEFSFKKLGNMYLPMSTKPFYPSVTTYPPMYGNSKIDRGLLYRHPSDENDTNLRKKKNAVNRANNEKNSILDWDNWKDQNTIEDKQEYNLNNLSQNKQASILNAISNYQNNYPLIHTVYNGHIPLDIQLDDKSTGLNLQYWNQYLSDSGKGANSTPDVTTDTPSGYSSSGMYSQSLPDGSQLVYPSEDSLQPSGIIKPDGTYHTLDDKTLLDYEESQGLLNSNPEALNVTPFRSPTGTTNYVVDDDGNVNGLYINTIFNLDVKSYYYQNHGQYILNNKLVIPYFIQGTNVSADVDNDFDSSLQLDYEDSKSISVNGNNTDLKTAFKGEAVPSNATSDSQYHQEKGNNYVVTVNHKINPVLTAYISQWINKYLNPSTVVEHMKNSEPNTDDTYQPSNVHNNALSLQEAVKQGLDPDYVNSPSDVGNNALKDKDAIKQGLDPDYVNSPSDVKSNVLEEKDAINQGLDPDYVNSPSSVQKNAIKNALDPDNAVSPSNDSNNVLKEKDAIEQGLDPDYVNSPTNSKGIPGAYDPDDVFSPSNDSGNAISDASNPDSGGFYKQPNINIKTKDGNKYIFYDPSNGGDNSDSTD